MQDRNEAKAFTLVELLVVVAVIALLIAILLPTMDKARQAVRTAVCLSNQHQLHLAYLGYMSDNRRSFPLFNTVTGHFGPGNGPHQWTAKIRQYHGSVQVQHCPEAPQDGGGYTGTYAEAWGNGVAQGFLDDESGSYGMSAAFYSRTAINFSSQDKLFPTLSAVNAPAITPWIGDSVWLDGMPKNPLPLADQAFNYYTPDWNGNHIRRWTIDRHDRRVNVLMIDGSGATHPLGRLWTFVWHAKFRPEEAADLTF